MKDASGVFTAMVVVVACLAMAFGWVDVALIVFGAAIGRLLFMALEAITGEQS